MSKNRGFTLIELLVVVAIIAVLAGVGYPLALTFIGKSREAACLGNLRQLGVGLQSYLQDHNNIMPDLKAGRAAKTEDVAVLDTVLLSYLGSPDAFQCPADKQQFKTTGCSYFWNFLLSGKPVSQLSVFGLHKDRPDKIPLISDKEAWHPHGTNFLYADLSVSNKVRFAAGN